MNRVIRYTVLFILTSMLGWGYAGERLFTDDDLNKYKSKPKEENQINTDNMTSFCDYYLLKWKACDHDDVSCNIYWGRQWRECKFPPVDVRIVR